MTRTFHNDEIWAVIREDYLRGDTQPGLAERFGVGVSTIRDRARREGWRKRDQPSALSPALDLLPSPAGSEPMRPAVACVADAYRAADDALRAGRFVEAQRCLAIARGFERLAARADGLARALSEHWDGEAEAWSVRHDPPWPHGVADPEGARAALAALTDDYKAALTHLPLDFGLLSALADRMARLRACLDLTDEWEVAGVPFEPPDPDLPPFTALGPLEALKDRPVADPPPPPGPPCKIAMADEAPAPAAPPGSPTPPKTSPPTDPRSTAAAVRSLSDERARSDAPA